MEKEDNGKLTIKERLEKLDAILDSYEVGLGLSKYQEDLYSESDFNKYTEMGQAEREKLTIVQCAEIAVTLNSMAYYIGRSINREKARLTWANAQIKNIISGTTNQFVGSWQSQENQAIKQDAAASKLDSIRTYCQQRLDRISYLPNFLKNLADSYNNLQRAKVMNNG